MRCLLALAAVGAAIVAARPAAAQITLAENRTTTGPNVFFPGQSATTPVGGPFGSLTFNFYSDAATTTPTAGGTLFILTQQYTGAPADLSSNTTGYLGQSTGIVGGIYQFDPGVTLAGGTQYFFYANESFRVSGCSPSCYAGGAVFASFSATDDFFSPVGGDDAAFRLAGITAPSATVPEPGTWALLGTGLLAVGGVARRRARA